MNPSSENKLRHHTLDIYINGVAFSLLHNLNILRKMYCDPLTKRISWMMKREKIFFGTYSSIPLFKMLKLGKTVLNYFTYKKKPIGENLVFKSPEKVAEALIKYAEKTQKKSEKNHEEQKTFDWDVV